MKESGLRLKKKLQNKAGETIAETLVTMIILSLAVLMLAGAVVTTARVNKQADNTDTSFQTRQTGAEVSTGTNSTKVIQKRMPQEVPAVHQVRKFRCRYISPRQTVWKRVIFIIK